MCTSITLSGTKKEYILFATVVVSQYNSPNAGSLVSQLAVIFQRKLNVFNTSRDQIEKQLCTNRTKFL